jgi:DGQHR domain-containing protein
MTKETRFAIEFEQGFKSNKMVTFWLCTMKYKHLDQITYVARRGESTEEGAVQRLLNTRRVKDIREFILDGGIFSNSVILNWTSDKLFQFQDNQLELELDRDVAQIIDGQHRIEGIKRVLEKNPEFGEIEIPTVFSKKLDTNTCARIFLSINTKQLPVPKSLVYDLYSTAFPDKDYTIDRARDIAEILNQDEDSPYYGWIKFPGANRTAKGIQLSTVINNLKKLVKRDEGEFFKVSIESLEKQVLLLKNYFSIFKVAYGQNWNKNHNPFIFSAGFNAAIELLSTDLLQHCFAKKDFSKEMFESLLQLDKSNLIYQSEVKGLSGESAKEKLRTRLKEFVNKDRRGEEDYKW